MAIQVVSLMVRMLVRMGFGFREVSLDRAGGRLIDALEVVDILHIRSHEVATRGDIVRKLML